MIRDALTPEARNVYAFAQPTQQARMQTRETTAGSTAQFSASAPAENRPVWLRVTRTGSTFAAGYSYDGSNYTTIGTRTVSMGSTVYLGMAITSHNAAELASAVVEQVQTTGSVVNGP